jgi:hypothetical protein
MTTKLTLAEVRSMGNHVVRTADALVRALDRHLPRTVVVSGCGCTKSLTVPIELLREAIKNAKSPPPGGTTAAGWVMVVAAHVRDVRHSIPSIYTEQTLKAALAQPGPKMRQLSRIKNLHAALAAAELLSYAYLHDVLGAGQYQMADIRLVAEPAREVL